jgi:hypothetical protein
MKKFIFITPEGLTFKPNRDSPGPDYLDMQVFDFGREHTVEDTLNDLIDLNQNGRGNGSGGPFSIRIENDHRKNFWLSEHRSKISRAS